MKRRAPLLLAIVAFGYAFLYVPILSVMIYSFNGSRLVTLWGGFSLRWYASLLENEELLEAAFLSLRIAAVSATVATCLGALVALAMQRLTRLRGRLLRPFEPHFDFQKMSPRFRHRNREINGRRDGGARVRRLRSRSVSGRSLRRCFLIHRKNQSEKKE